MLCLNLQVELIECGKDHIYILVEVDPQFGIHRFVKRVKGAKGVSSKILRDEFKFLKTRLPTLWTNSYFVSTVEGEQYDWHHNGRL